jgi:hypothetical protein
VCVLLPSVSSKDTIINDNYKRREETEGTGGETERAIRYAQYESLSVCLLFPPRIKELITPTALSVLVSIILGLCVYGYFSFKDRPNIIDT